MMLESDVLKNIIRARRSVTPNNFIKKEIPKDVLMEVLESANYAPTHKLTQPWRFVVIRNEGKVKLGNHLGDLYKAQVSEDNFLQKKYDSFAIKAEQSDCIIAINMKLSGRLPEWEELAAVSCSVQNLALTAHSLGLGGYWSSPPLIHSLGKFLSLEEDEKCIGLFYLGYRNDETYKINRTPIENKVRWIEE